MLELQHIFHRWFLLGIVLILLVMAVVVAALDIWVIRGLLLLMALAIAVAYIFSLRALQSVQSENTIKSEDVPVFNLYQTIEEAVFVATMTGDSVKGSPVLQFYAVNAAVRRYVGASLPLLHPIKEKDFSKWIGAKRLENLRNYCEQCLNTRSLVEFEDEHRLHADSIWWSVRLVPSEEAGKIIGVAIDVTTSKRIISELRQSEEKFSAAMNAMTEGLVIQDPTGIITFSNPESERILGLTNDQMLGRTSVDPRWHSMHEDGSAFPGETHPAMMVLKTGKPQRNVVMGVHKPDASLTWILINSQPIFMPDGTTIRAAVTSFSDITTYITSIAALREQERLYSTLVGNLPGMVYRCLNDEQWTMIYVSPGVLELTGYTADILLNNQNLSFNDLVLPEDRDWLWERCQYSLEHRIPCQNTYQIRHKSGEVRWVFDRATGIYDERGILVNIEGFIQDITAQKLADERLQESETRYRRLFSIMEEGVAINELIFDEQGEICDYKILDISAAFERHAPFKTHEVLGKTATEIYKMTSTFIREWWQEHSQRTTAIRTDFYHEPTGMWFDIVTTPIEANQFATIFTNITPRKQAEEQLRQQATLLQFISDAVITTDMELRITGWNEAARTMYGWNTTEVLGQIVDELLQTVFIEATQHEAQKKLATTGIWQGKMYQTTKSGKKIILDSAVTWLKDGVGAVIGGIAINRDITDRVHAEETVRRLNNLLSDASTMAQFGAFEIDLTTNGMTASEQVYAILDRNPAQSLRGAEEILQSLQFTSDNITRSQLEDLLRYGGELDIEIGLQTLSGNLRWVRIIAHTETREQKPVRLYGALQDITEQKRAEEALRESQQRFYTLFDEAPVGIVLAEPESGRFVEINRKFAEILQFDINELLLRTFFDVTHPDDLQHGSELLKKINTGDRTSYSVEKRYLRKDGSVVWANLVVARLSMTTEQGRKPIIIGVIKDITDRIHAQEEVRQLNLDLERKVLERTQDLVKLNQEKDEFLGIAAHDLKNPLSGIRTSAELIDYYLSKNKTEHVARFARTIMQASEQMVDIINRFLDIHKIETGSMDLQLEPQTMEALETLVYAYQERAAQKGIIVQLLLPVIPKYIVNNPKKY